MKATLVRVAVDQSYGAWNGPVNRDNNFVYVPIPEGKGAIFHLDHERKYCEVLPGLQRFRERCGPTTRDTELPIALRERAMHLDPDFEYLTYGDVGDRRGRQIATMQRDDFIVFYAGLKPVHTCEHKLLYALIGLYIVDEVVAASAVSDDRRCENAHTRKSNYGASDIVVRARRGVSGRFEHCLPIGEFRDRAYRVRPEVLDAWGGLSVKDGYLQRSVVPPHFLQPQQFMKWLGLQNVTLVANNH